MDPKPCAACLNELTAFVRAFSDYKCVEQLLWLKTRDLRTARNGSHLMRLAIPAAYGVEPFAFPTLQVGGQVVGNLMMILDAEAGRVYRREIISTGMTSNSYKEAIAARYFPCGKEE